MVTARIRKGIQSVYFDETKYTFDKNGNTRSYIPGSATEKSEQKAIELMVVSIDGSEDEVYEKMLDLDDKSYREIYRAVDDALSAGMDDQKKTKSAESTSG